MNDTMQKFTSKKTCRIFFHERKNEFIRWAKKVYHSLSHKERECRKNLLELLDEKLAGCRMDGKFKEEASDWQYNFEGMIREAYGKRKIKCVEQVLIGFFDEPLTLLKKSVSADDRFSAVAVSAVKNDLVYMKKMLPYYRQLGLKHFIFIDNGSEDGTVEFLAEQPDVTLYQASYPFKGEKKVGWKLQTIARLGLKRWYLWLDSDEFFAYPGMEKMSFHELLALLESRGIGAMRGFMLDMYPKYPLMQQTGSDADFLEDYCYFDVYGKYYVMNGIDHILSGGMRNRMMGIDNLRLDKIPLVYCTRGRIPSENHTIFSMDKRVFQDQFCCVLKHYKFLPSDYKKYREIAENDHSGYASNEIQKKYVQMTELCAYGEESAKYEDSNSLLSFPFVCLPEEYCKRINGAKD